MRMATCALIRFALCIAESFAANTRKCAFFPDTERCVAWLIAWSQMALRHGDVGKVSHLRDLPSEVDVDRIARILAEQRARSLKQWFGHARGWHLTLPGCVCVQGSTSLSVHG